MMKNSIRLTNKKWLKFCLLWLTSFTILLSLLISDFFYYFNYLEVSPSEITFVLVLTFLTSLMVSFSISILPWPKLFASKILAVALLAFSINNYDIKLNAFAGFFRSLIPALPTANKDLPIISIFYFLTLIGISVLVGVAAERVIIRHKSSEIKKRFRDFLLVFIAVLGVWQIIHLASVLPSIVSQSKTTPEQLADSKKTPEQKPDIYYIVLDRYANNEVLKNQFNFDNSAFLNKLKNLNFEIKNNAYSNYPLTSMSIASTLNAVYLNEVVSPYKDNSFQSRTLYHNLIYQSSVIQALKGHGYEYYQIGSDYGATDRAPLADQEMSFSYQIFYFGKSKKLRSFEITQFDKSIFRQFFDINWRWSPFGSIRKDKVKFVGDQLASLNTVAIQKQDDPKFVFAHILVPHDPFVFNKDGSISPYQATDDYGKPLKIKYLDQLQYINKEMAKTIDLILENSKNEAVILLNSDEGAYPQNMYSSTFDLAVPLDYMSKSDMESWPQNWLAMKFGILQAVHIPKAQQKDLQNLSSVNLFRIIFNSYLGYDLDYLPDCNYGFSEGDRYEFNFKDLTNQVQQTSRPKCSEYQSLR